VTRETRFMLVFVAVMTALVLAVVGFALR